METKANYLLVAVFSVVVLLLAAGFFYWIGRYGDSQNKTMLEIRVPGSVSGLSNRGPVYFNGLQVGQVRRMFIDERNPDAIIVQTEIDSATPITRSTKASLSFQLLTGTAWIELTGGKADEPNLLAAAEAEDLVARIDIDPASLKTLVQTAQDWIDRAEEVTDLTEKYLADTRGPLLESINQAKQFTDGLADSTAMIEDYGQRAQKLETLAHDAREVVQRINSASSQVDEKLVQIDRQLSNDKDSMVSQIRTRLQSYRQQAKELNETMTGLTARLGTLTGERLRNAQRVISDSRRSVERIERAVRDFQDDPSKLIFGEDDGVPTYSPRR